MNLTTQIESNRTMAIGAPISIPIDDSVIILAQSLSKTKTN